MGQTCSQCLNDREPFETNIKNQLEDKYFPDSEFGRELVKSKSGQKPIISSYVEDTLSKNISSKADSDLGIEANGNSNNQTHDTSTNTKQNVVDDKFSHPDNLKLILYIQRLRRKVVQDDFIYYTDEAKKKQKANKLHLNYTTTRFINKMEKTKPFRLMAWKEFYPDNEENKNRFKIETPDDCRKMKIVDANYIYIGEADTNFNKNGFGVMKTYDGNMYKGIWKNNKLGGWCRIIKNNILTEGKI